MKLNIYNAYKCRCGEKAVATYSDNTTREDGSYRFIYVCQSHFKTDSRALKLWEVKCYENITNEFGGVYMKPTKDFEPLNVFLERELKENIQINLL